MARPNQFGSCLASTRDLKRRSELSTLEWSISSGALSLDKSAPSATQSPVPTVQLRKSSSVLRTDKKPVAGQLRDRGSDHRRRGARYEDVCNLDVFCPPGAIRNS
jgi:hypothetical protein